MQGLRLGKVQLNTKLFKFDQIQIISLDFNQLFDGIIRKIFYFWNQ